MQLGSGCGAVSSRLASLASPSSAGLGEQKPLFSCGCQGAEGLIPTGWDPPLNPSWEKTGTNPALPPCTNQL